MAVEADEPSVAGQLPQALAVSAATVIKEQPDGVGCGAAGRDDAGRHRHVAASLGAGMGRAASALVSAWRTPASRRWLGSTNSTSTGSGSTSASSA